MEVPFASVLALGTMKSDHSVPLFVSSTHITESGALVSVSICGAPKAWVERIMCFFQTPLLISPQEYVADINGCLSDFPRNPKRTFRS